MRLLIFVMFFPLFLRSQKQTSHIEQLWIGYFNQSRLSDKWGIWIDGHLRTKEEIFTDLSQGIGRVGLTYYLKENTKLTVGYAYVHHFPSDNHKNIAQPEHRPWQQIQWHNRYEKMRMMQWIRLEERYRRRILNDDELAEGFNFNWRIRYNFFVSFPLSPKAFAPNTVSFVANDELHINMGKEIVYNYFDQNRFFLGLAYHLNNHDNLQFGYMNVFQQLTAGNRYRSNHVIRLFYFQNLDFRSKSKS